MARTRIKSTDFTSPNMQTFVKRSESGETLPKSVVQLAELWARTHKDDYEDVRQHKLSQYLDAFRNLVVHFTHNVVRGVNHQNSPTTKNQD